MYNINNLENAEEFRFPLAFNFEKFPDLQKSYESGGVPLSLHQASLKVSLLYNHSTMIKTR